LDVERVHQQPCFVLHQRPYKNTSLIVEVISRDYGRVSLVAKAVKQQKSPLKSILHSFQPLSISWVRRSEMGTLTAAEFSKAPLLFAEDKLYAAFYLNELLMRLLAQHDPVQEIFLSYETALHKLNGVEETEVILRVFEKELLQSLGYEIRLSEEADTHLPIVSEKHYQFTPEYGFTAVEIKDVSQQHLFKGEHLLAFNENRLTDKEILKSAHRITFINLKKLLGDKPLKSRELLLAFKAIG